MDTLIGIYLIKFEFVLPSLLKESELPPQAVVALSHSKEDARLSSAGSLES